jgi:ABC-type Mn2+/Zn2+ transport system permease subunit
MIQQIFNVFKEPFMLMGMGGGTIIACLCAYLGLFVHIKKITFISIALSQVAALGIAVGWFIGLNPTLCAFIFTMLGIVLFWLPNKNSKITKESIIGFIYIVSAALSVILIAKNPIAETRGLNLFSGNLLYLNMNDLLIIGLAAIFICILHIVFYKEFIFVSFDKETALTTGLRANHIDFLLYLSIGIVISLTMKTSGIIFVFGSLIIPPITALIVAKKASRIIFLSPIFALASVVLGFFTSYFFDLPTSATVVGFYALNFILVFTFQSVTPKPK